MILTAKSVSSMLQDVHVCRLTTPVLKTNDPSRIPGFLGCCAVLKLQQRSMQHGAPKCR